MDAVSPDLVPAAREAIGTVDGVLSVDSVRLRWIGHSLHADAEVVVPAGISVAEGHDIAHHAEAHLLERLPRLHSAVIHVGPASSSD
jgi:divalent metal cation (Fe/Co/Zn/Cd) transporter